MVRNYLLTLCFVFLGTFAFAQTSLNGKVTDVETGEDLIGANIVLQQNGAYKAGASTDFDGNFSLSVDPGTYDVEVSYIGYPPNLVTGVVVNAGQANTLDVKLGGGEDGINLDEVVVIEYKVPLIEKDNTTSGGVVTAEQIRNLPTKNINALAAQTAGLSSADEGDDVNVRGSRSNGTDYYIDGIRVSGNLIPQSEIEQMQVITGGIEAQYGDVTGGIISITTKGPSGKFGGGIEVETSEFLDPYGYNLGSINLSGPILRKKETKESILGFRVSGQYLQQRDDDPTAIDIYKVKPEVLTQLQEQPIVTIGGTTKVSAAEFLTGNGIDSDSDVEIFDYRPNEESVRYDLTAKLDARLSSAVDITLSGSYRDNSNKFTPAGNSQTDPRWTLLNSHRNPTDHDWGYRGNFRFRHRLGGSGGVSAEDAELDEAAKRGSVFRNAQYSLTLGYQKNLGELNDAIHGNNPFRYGYVGDFDYNWEPTFDYSLDSLGELQFLHEDYAQRFGGFTRGEVNPTLARYNDASDPNNPNDLIAINGFTSDLYDSSWGLHSNVGRVYNLIQKNENDIYTFNATSSFDFLPGGSEKGVHNIQFGILYEQRVDRDYELNPRRLWTIAQLQANRHILGVDTSNIIGTISAGDPNYPLNGNTALFPVVNVYGTIIEDFSGNAFYREVRNLTGQSLNEYVNVDGLNPDDLNLAMFSPAELTADFDILRYNGYDYLGNKVDGDVTFDDFFSDRIDINGQSVRSFIVAPNRPIYSAAYIQDKFTFKDIIFRLGLRVDRYDANTKVLKDPYSLYDLMSASDFYANNPDEVRPESVQDDWKIYTQNATGSQVRAYRDGDQWYFANGTAANDGTLIFGGEIVNPVLVNRNADIKADNFDTSNSFEDYEPQVNWTPRLAFSFPISDAANFFAHYDVLVQRPPSNSITTPQEYYYFNERTPENNPNLKPEKTIDYEVGFQQKLSNSSALKIAAYYKEMRDMIQSRTFLHVPSPVNAYDSFDNLDFGTVKGFTFQYDLRRTGNISLTANYTLQFADGTGSDAESQRGNTSRGNLRVLFPLSFDERHRLTTNIDYRYGSGKKYNGPKWFGADIFANAGINLQAIAVSGRPYSANREYIQLDGQGIIGSINGARLPWNMTLNGRIDKDFRLTKADSKFPLDLNVYFRVQNILDRKNIISVYPSSGSASDDGYLVSSNGLDSQGSVLSAGKDLQSFTDSYQWRLLNPSFFSLPRRLYLGAILEF